MLINSPRDVATYDLKPQMSAVEVTDTLLRALAEREAAGTPYDLVILNFANGDMVGHTGVMAAAVTACETVDRCVGRIHQFVKERGGIMLITADHGNAEMMVNPETGGPYTAHTLNPVPFYSGGRGVRASNSSWRRGAQGYRPDHPGPDGIADSSRDGRRESAGLP